jgi:hypothetical protein
MNIAEIIRDHSADTQTATIALDRIERLLAAIDPGLRQDVLTERKRAAFDQHRELLDPAWGALRTREPELQRARVALNDPEKALLVAAVEKAEQLTPGDQILAGQLGSLSPAEIESMIQLLSARPTLLLVLRGAIDQADLDGPGKAALRQKVVEAGRAFIPQPQIRALAAAELAGLQVQTRRAALEGRPGMPVDKLTQGRRQVELEAILA